MWSERLRAASAAAVLTALAGAAPVPTGAQIPPPTPPTAQPTLPIPSAAPDTVTRIDVARDRMHGVASLEEAVRLRRAAYLVALPMAGPPQGSVILPDGGGALGIATAHRDPDGSTDRTLEGSSELHWGVPDLAAALDDPRGTGFEALDLDGLEFPEERAYFRGAGESLARAAPRAPWVELSESSARKEQKARSTLYYRNGDHGDLATGARFLVPAWGRRIYASYTRLEGDGLDPLGHAKSTRYAVAASLPRLGAHDLAVGWWQLKRTMEDRAAGRAEWERREMGLRASREGSRSSDSWSLLWYQSKRTQVVSESLLAIWPYARERWRFPGGAVEGAFEWRASPALTGVASVAASLQRVSYRTGATPEFDPRRAEARGHVGFRRSLGARSGFGADLAYDARETERSEWDARISLWGRGATLAGRLDLESAHERPTWIDRLTPARAVSLSGPSSGLAFAQITRSGDPSLAPRRLQGLIGSGSYRPWKQLTLESTASIRRIIDDFGWDLVSVTSGDSLFVEDLARERGSGWVSHASLAWEFDAGILYGRGVGWVREGPSWLSPRAGSPPRRALDAALELRRALFRGDLRLRLGAEAHARASRHGAIEEPAQITWDGTVTGDLGDASVFLRWDNVFDRATGSAVWAPEFGSGAPAPGRNFRVGVVWNLVD